MASLLVHRKKTFSNAEKRLAFNPDLHGTVSVSKESAQDKPVHDFEGFIGHSEPMRHVYAILKRIAPSQAAVFVTGESGTGKEVCAQAIHNLSTRQNRQCVALNCSAIPHDLMESEIFGHIRGAFTGATDDRAGAAELADGGTLFLDEVCEMDLGLQAKLLRFIQTGEVQRLGARQAKKVNVRFICATNRDPAAEVAAGRFREDLFYRLHVLPVHLPPLRLRGDDIVMLARSFLKRYAQEESRHFAGFDVFAEHLLAAYNWPGNVRQLQNVIRRIVVLNDGDRVTADMLPREIACGVLGAKPDQVAGDRTVKTAENTKIMPLWMHEQRIIEEAIVLCGGNTAKAAAALEISPSTIYRKRLGWEAMGAAPSA